ncbi:ubiquitin thioesterase otulin isoform X2 [Pogoniulus pusillus]|uniref:ubiquitin thioesterase otulin isoform X2 n=1 Tax=Pogoniulus pusillus TaxID=488313 RepID=UPI0030B93A43
MNSERRTGGGPARGGELRAPHDPGERATGAEAPCCLRRGAAAAAGGPERSRVRGPAGQRERGSQDNFQGWMTEAASLPAGAKQMQKKVSVAIHLMKPEREVHVPSKKLASAAAKKEHPTAELKEDYVHGSTGRTEKTDTVKSLVSDQTASRTCEFYLPVSCDPSTVESSEDSGEEDMYRDAEEIEREKVLLCQTSSSEQKLSVAPEMDIMEYCRKEWRGDTPVAKKMRKGYEAVAQKFQSIRRVRGDNYCALRATLFQALSQATQLPSWLHSEDFTMWKNISEIKGPLEKQEACDKLFKNEEEEYSLFEALKFLMLNTAIKLYNDDKNGMRVPVFSWLLFARDTSSNPCQLMHNHLNHIGHSGGLEQVEMFLLAYTLQYTIQVYRLYKYSTDEFITLYPNDPEEDWPVVTLITEDDRHYNIPVRMCQETML